MTLKTQIQMANLTQKTNSCNEIFKNTEQKNKIPTKKMSPMTQ